MKKNKEKNFISAIVYLHNNESEIKDFISKLDGSLADIFDKYEIICVNDACTDKTVNIINSYSKENSSAVVSIINMSYFQGLEKSMNAGIDLAIGDFVYEFDYVCSDYDFNLISEIYYDSLKGFDIVRVVNKKQQRGISKLYYKVFNRYSETQYNIESEQFRILSRRAINRVKSISKIVSYRKAIYANCGLKMDTIYYEGNVRKHNHNFKNNKDIAMDSLVLFTNAAYKISMFLSVLFIIFTFIIGIYTITIFIAGKPVAGYTSTMLLLSVAFFGLFLVLSIIIKYLQVIIELIFKKQNYLIESIDKISK